MYFLMVGTVLIILTVAVGCIQQLLREHKQKQGK
ncbi:hypothetical protein RCIP0072_00009 [Klebsiella phage RCIP0072]|jgi:hypothetical protein|uniref:Uncharacterized protein n=1 Tax=Klebsiella phage FK1979 TaxID=2936831 RepID=A0AAE9HH67_9CAUD|nr:hypothetical protein HCLLCEGK_00056 [Klebsiella phage FK1979]